MKKDYFFRYIVLFSMLFFVSSSMNAQGTLRPYSVSHCENGRIYLQFPPITEPWSENNPIPELQYWINSYFSENAPYPAIEVSFGEGCDNRNGANKPNFEDGFNFTEDGTYFYKYLIISSPTTDLCSGDLSHFAIKLPDIGWLVYEYGILCPSCPLPDCETELEDCTNWINECGDDLYSFLDRYEIGSEGCEQWEGECGINSLIQRKGLTMIGTDTEPESQNSLAVKGGVLTSKVKVSPANNAPGWGNIENGNQNEWWCDYVFEDSYNLMPLLEIEKFINKHKHLPRTPSAAEIKREGGYEIGSVLFNHQEKVEEIFLHLIDLDKQITEMKQVIKQE